MKPSRRLVAVLAAVLALAAAAPAGASFHLMQIEQVAGGFCGLPEAQAIQLRMRTAGQNLTTGAQLIARDDAGANPVTLITIPGNVANAAGGARILFATPAFVAAAGGPTPDFTLTNPIPASYLDAGKLTFGAAGIVYWALAWGGASYTGTNTGAIDNDADGNFNPPFASPLPLTGDTAVRFTGTAGAASTNNAADYALSASPATFTNNAGSSAAINVCVFYDGFESGDASAWSSVVPP
jgi:hypothetical protein